MSSQQNYGQFSFLVPLLDKAVKLLSSPIRLRLQRLLSAPTIEPVRGRSSATKVL
jgi:hypothetical protein